MSCNKFGTKMGKEVQKRWRSIRDSYTKSYRQGKCAPEQCQPGSRRYQYHKQMSFLHRALQNRKPRYSQDKYESYSEVSNSPQHPAPDEVIPRIKHETIDKPLDLKTKPDPPEKPDTVDKCNQATIKNAKSPSLEIKIDANSILPDDHFDDDKLFMNSLLPLFKKMDDDTRLLCRIEVLKIIRYALQGNKCFEALKMAEDSFFKNRISGILAKEEVLDTPVNSPKNALSEPKLSMTTRSADGSRPVRKRRARSPSPLPMPPKKRGPGRPRKVRPPPSDSEEEPTARKQYPKLKVAPVEISHLSEYDETLNRATSVSQLPKPMFMRMYNLERSKPSQATPPAQSVQVTVKSEPIDTFETTQCSNM
ncbi:PREDICTED: uncharacterized protein LOC106125800 isoform X2 [Papilio xuthus]|uniref:Uncharacterized protein LOC106125800 isoform X2 n=1 Tax=Papilio xuthus TaxID=66420 RepID=A0AAJ7EIG8_PAPXU|nr:PREDICTED: uncharacterized protein LOC106125800 isoform X2 [Papilio xuthus]